MTTVYLIRHCEATGNQNRTFQGSTDAEITELGRIQLGYLNKRFKDVPLDAVYSSPLMRAKLTAHAVADDKGLPVIVEPGFSEICGGKIEGLTFAQIFEKYPQLEYNWGYAPEEFDPPEGEHMRKVYERVNRALKNAVEQYKGKSIAVATHGAAIRNLLAYYKYGSIEGLKNIPWSENTAVTKITFNEKGEYNLEYFNDSSHVPPEYLPKRSRIGTFYNPEDDR